jgi:hypothetical protein
MTKTISKIALLLGGVSALAIAHSASALEMYSPYQPGVSTGVPAGALPPPGVYLDIDTFLNAGPIVDGSGNKTGAKLQMANVTPLVLWVPGWKVLGANYAANIIQPFSQTTIITPGPRTSDNGFFNTIITPEILSWNLGGGAFASEGLGIYLPDGDYRGNSAGEALTSYANNFVTFEPNVAFSYLGGGWNLTLNNVFDFNTENTQDHYQSGAVYYLDYTIAHDVGPFTLGLIGNYSQQFTNDTRNGVVIPAAAGNNGTGNKWAHASVGPLVAWHLGKATVTARLLYGFWGENGGNPTFFHLGVSFPVI